MTWQDFCRKRELDNHKKQQLLKLTTKETLCGLNLNTLRWDLVLKSRCILQTS